MRVLGRARHPISWRTAVALALFSLVALSCRARPPAELVVFTDDMRQRYELEPAELRELQFYLSEHVVLERVAEKGVGRVDRGRLIVRSGTTIHQVVVRRRTPGVIEADGVIGASTGGHVLAVSFEPGAPLRFSAAKPGGPYTLVDPVERGLLAELLREWGKPRRRIVDFAGARWPVIEGDGAKLLVEKNALGKLRRTRRILPGVKVDRKR